MGRWSESRYRVAGRINYSSGHLPERLSESRAREERELRAMASVNLVILMGNLGGDPELRWTESGKAFCSFSLATTENWIDREGMRQAKTEWHRIKVWGKTAENCSKYLKKGSSIYLEGKISTSKWMDRDGKENFTTEIVTESIKFLTPPAPKPQLPAHMNHEPEEASFRHRGIE